MSDFRHSTEEERAAARPIIEALRAEGANDVAVMLVCEAMMLASGRKNVTVSPADLVAAVQEVAIAHHGAHARAELETVGLGCSADVGTLTRTIERLGGLASVPGESLADYDDLPWFSSPRPALPKGATPRVR